MTKTTTNRTDDATVAVVDRLAVAIHGGGFDSLAKAWDETSTADREAVLGCEEAAREIRRAAWDEHRRRNPHEGHDRRWPVLHLSAVIPQSIWALVI
jgi:hypothetical protein